MAATLKIDTLQNAASPVANLTLDTSGNVTGGGTIADSTAVIRPLVSGTSVASTSGTAIDFTGVPSWVKRITVVLSGVSVSGTSAPLIQLGAGSVTSSGYIAQSYRVTGGVLTTSTAGFPISSAAGANVIDMTVAITLYTTNSWACAGSGAFEGANPVWTSGYVALSGSLDRIRITTVNGTDTFDAGTINIMYE